MKKNYLPPLLSSPFRSTLCTVVILWATLSFIHPLQAQTLSPGAKVSLITVGPGNQLYSSFGHSVLWIFDPEKQIDRAYNYGSFSFETGNFYIKFLRGTLPYLLDVDPFYNQLFYWQSVNRSVKEQVLNLSPAQKEKLFQILETNYLPQNREYNYKFFYDNCSSRLQVVLKQACGDSLQFPGYTAESLSFRQWIDRYAYKQKPWADFGMDLAIGAPSDEIATPLQATFLPDNLSAAFDEAKNTINGRVVPLVASKTDLYVPVDEPASTHWLTPMVVFWLLAAATAGLTFWQTKKEIINFTFDRVLFSVVGLTGWLILLLWFGTNHGVTEWNYDILWAFPLWLPAIFLISPDKKPSWFSFFLLAYGLMLLIATSNLLKHNYVVIPILITLIIRVYYLNNLLSKIPVTDPKKS